MAQGISCAETRVTLNRWPAGCGRNTYLAWQDGFALADFIIHVEDDTVPAPDCLRYLEHCRAAYARDQAIFSVSTYHREPCAPADYYRIGRRSRYTCWLVGLWSDRWLWARDDWNPDPKRYACHLADRVKARGLQEVHPLLSRSQNIGATRGLHVPSAEWHRQHQHTEHWAGALNLPSGPYFEAAPALEVVSGATAPRLSYCITCMGRRHHLQQTLPRNLAENSLPEVEFVLLDYNSPDGLREWVRENFAPELRSGKLAYYRTQEPRYYHSAHAKNTVHRLARGEILCNLDADNFAGREFTEYLLRAFSAQPDLIIQGTGDRGVIGRVALVGHWFHQLGGYDEQLQDWGHDDNELVARAVRLGLKHEKLPAHFTSCLKHGNEERLANFPPERRAFSQRNREISAVNLAAGRLVANAGRRWGEALLAND